MNVTDLKNPSITLEFVKSKFDHWRKTRKGKEKIPDELWEYAKQLHPQFRSSLICYTLKLSYKDFKSKLTPIVSPVKQLPSFAECVLPTSFNENKKDGALEFIRKDGLVLKLNGFSTKNLLPIVSLFLAEQQ